MQGVIEEVEDETENQSEGVCHEAEHEEERKAGRNSHEVETEPLGEDLHYAQH